MVKADTDKNLKDKKDFKYRLFLNRFYSARCSNI